MAPCTPVPVMVHLDRTQPQPGLTVMGAPTLSVGWHHPKSWGPSLDKKEK